MSDVKYPRHSRMLSGTLHIHEIVMHNISYCSTFHNSTTWQFTVLPCGLSTSLRVFTKILKPVQAYAHLHRVKLHMYLDDWLLNLGTHQEALDQTSWLKSLCQRLGLVFKPREIRSNPISGCASPDG